MKTQIAIIESALDINVTKYLVMLRETHEITYCHSIATAYYTINLLEKVNLTEEQKKNTVKGALLHDVGKMYVPSEILRKKSALTKEEFEIIKQHPALGADMLHREPGVNKTIENIARNHHERLNGKGYLRGIADVDIETHIVTIADVYDALTSSRCYKETYKHEDAIKIMEKEVLEKAMSAYLFSCIKEEAPLNEKKRRELCKKVSEKIDISSNEKADCHAPKGVWFFGGSPI